MDMAHALCVIAFPCLACVIALPQHGWSPQWDKDANSATTLRTRHVAAEVVGILGKKDILAAQKVLALSGIAAFLLSRRLPPPFDLRPFSICVCQCRACMLAQSQRAKLC